MKLLENIKKDIVPSPSETKEINTKVNTFLKKIKLANTKAIVGGSVAKGTWLKGHHDADLFILFDYKKFKEKTTKLSDMLEPVLKKKFKVSRLHGSRDYFQINIDRFTYEVIPILNIKKAEQAKNITDVSPLHAKWVNKNSNAKLKDDIRLFKAFCKANNVYGAESYIKGFSGYICEILTIHYKGFLKALKAISRWTDKEIIDTAKYYKNKNQIEYDLNKAKLQSPLIIIDPVQKDRNAAAALSKERYNELKSAAKAFLKCPAETYFTRKEVTIEQLKAKHKDKHLLLLEIKPKPGKIDIIGCKLIKALEHIKQQLEHFDFKVHEYSWDWNKKVLFWFYTDKKSLEKTKTIQGPPIRSKFHVENFKKAHKNTFEKNKTIFAKEKRKYIKAEDCLKEIIKDKYVKERVKSIMLPDKQ